tara:strand:+ start:893 stop:1018 length:126 start_codon:yes stop_codon:yes gene_type:complete
MQHMKKSKMKMAGGKKVKMGYAGGKKVKMMSAGGIIKGPHS